MSARLAMTSAAVGLSVLAGCRCGSATEIDASGATDAGGGASTDATGTDSGTDPSQFLQPGWIVASISVGAAGDDRLAALTAALQTSYGVDLVAETNEAIAAGSPLVGFAGYPPGTPCNETPTLFWQEAIDHDGDPADNFTGTEAFGSVFASFAIYFQLAVQGDGSWYSNSSKDIGGYIDLVLGSMNVRLPALDVHMTVQAFTPAIEGGALTGLLPAVTGDALLGPAIAAALNAVLAGAAVPGPGGCVADSDCGANLCSATNGSAIGFCVVATPAVAEIRSSTTDADGDGAVTPAEALAAAPIVAALYLDADRDGDGALDSYSIRIGFEAPTCFFEEPAKPR